MHLQAMEIQTKIYEGQMIKTALLQFELATECFQG